MGHGGYLRVGGQVMPEIGNKQGSGKGVGPESSKGVGPG